MREWGYKYSYLALDGGEWCGMGLGAIPDALQKCYLIPAGEGHPLLTHGSAAFKTKRTVSKNSKMFSGDDDS
jgi:hypothetical protein